jgi:excisionase family DNA binding protein
MQTNIVTDTRKKRGTKVPSKHTTTKAKICAPVVITSEYMTTKQAAQYLNLSRQYLEAARYRGDSSGPPYIKLDRAVRYRRSALDSWMAAHDHSADKPI